MLHPISLPPMNIFKTLAMFGFFGLMGGGLLLLCRLLLPRTILKTLVMVGLVGVGMVYGESSDTNNPKQDS